MPPLPPYVFTGSTALLTGAASGMGEQLAYGLAARGSDLVLLDRDAEGLEAVAARLRAENPQRGVDTRVVDLADLESLEPLITMITVTHPMINLVINNAGVALGGRFDQVSAEDFDWLMAVNFHAPVVLTRLLLPALSRQPGSHIVNVSSLFGLIAPPGQTAYAASKFAIRGFSDALRHELAGRIGVTTVHPGGIRTQIAASARMPAGSSRAETERARDGFARLLTYPADRAAEDILRAVARRKGRLLIARSAVLPDVLARLLPGSYWAFLQRFMRQG